MLDVLMLVEFAGFIGVTCVVAWVRYPSHRDKYRLNVLRFLAPPVVILTLLAAIMDIHTLLLGRSLPAPPGGVVVLTNFMFALSILYAIVEVRKLRGKRTAYSRRARRT